MFPGVHVAITTPFDGQMAVDLDAYRQHCDWLISEGIDGLFPCGSLGEYESLDPHERRALVEAAIEIADGRAVVVPGVSGPSSRTVVSYAEHAANAGADGLMVLPPLIHPATDDELVDHFRQVAEVGLPVVAYNNPVSTRTDLTPERLARLAEIEGIVGVKEFSGDVRRVSAIRELAPDLEILCGADDVALESALMGAGGWIGGFTGVFPRAAGDVFRHGVKGNRDHVLGLYRAMLPALRWDTTPEFVQAIKLAIDEVGGSAGGQARPPRLPLSEDQQTRVRATVAAVQENLK